MSNNRRRGETWTLEEKQIFANLYQKYGNQYSKYREHLPNKSYNQIKGRYHNSIKQVINQFIDDPRERKRRTSKHDTPIVQKEVTNITSPFTETDLQQLHYIINYKENDDPLIKNVVDAKKGI